MTKNYNNWHNFFYKNIILFSENLNCEFELDCLLQQENLSIIENESM